MRAEGWYRDPYHLHADRWFSDGTPTELVRDGGLESTDPPPDTPFPRTLIEVESSGAVDGDDLRRADDPNPEGVYDSQKVADRAIDSLPFGPVN